MMVSIVIIVCLWVLYNDREVPPNCESPIEWRLYYALKRRGYNVKTQVKCGYYRIDLALSEYRIVVECDGKAYHSSPEQKKNDKKRSDFLYRQGWKSVLRFSGSEINKNPDACVDKIEDKLRSLGYDVKGKVPLQRL